MSIKSDRKKKKIMPLYFTTKEGGYWLTYKGKGFTLDVLARWDEYNGWTTTRIAAKARRGELG